MKYPRVEIGNKYERLTVLRHGSRNGYWVCECCCGNNKEIRGYSLKTGLIKSCGCLRRETMAQNAKLRIKHNIHEELEDKIKVYTPKNEVFYISKESKEVLNLNCCWWMNKEGYIYTIFKGTKKRVALHRFLLKELLEKPENKDKICDHIDGDPSNNCLSNLRVVTPTQNNLNVKRRKYYGIFKTDNSKTNPYQVILGQNTKIYYIGSFPNKEKALEARIAWEKENRETEYLRK